MTPGLSGELEGSFDFLTAKEIAELCPGVDSLLCDRHDQSSAASVIPIGSSWYHCIQHIAENEDPFSTSVMVAHRETIRNFCVQGALSTPYCCLGLLDYDTASKQLELIQVQDCNGVELENKIIAVNIDANGEISGKNTPAPLLDVGHRSPFSLFYESDGGCCIVQ